MKWRRVVPDEEIKTLSKEWELSGGRILRPPGIKPRMDFLDGYSWVCCYERQYDGTWHIYMRGPRCEVA